MYSYYMFMVCSVSFIIIFLFVLLKWICNVSYIYTFENANSKSYNCNIV